MNSTSLGRTWDEASSPEAVRMTRRFELAWRAAVGARPDPLDFLPAGPDERPGALLALLQADHLGQVRTGAASGVATQYLARPDASEVGLFGSGKQARTQLLAVCKVRKVRRVQVYSPNEEHRRKFAAEMSALCHTEIEPVPLQLQRSAAQARDGEQILHEEAHPADLATDDVEGPASRRIAR